MQSDLLARLALCERALGRSPVPLDDLALLEILNLSLHIGRGQLALKILVAVLLRHGTVFLELGSQRCQTDEVAAEAGGRGRAVGTFAGL